MSIEFLVLAAIIVIVGIVLFVRKNPDVAAQLHARLSETEARVQSMIDNRKPSASAPVDAVAGQASPAPADVDHVGIITAAMTGAAQVVQSLPKPAAPAAVDPLAAYGVTAAARNAPSNAAPVDVGGGGPPTVRPEQDGRDLWNETFWRCNLEAGKSASRDFSVPDGYDGVIEYFGDNAAMQGDFAVALDGQPLLGAGQELKGLAAGPHTLAATCVNPLSVGRTWATAALSIKHTP